MSNLHFFSSICHVCIDFFLCQFNFSLISKLIHFIQIFHASSWTSACVQFRYSLFMNQSDFWWIFYHQSLSWRFWESLLQNFLEISNFKRCIILYSLKSFFIQKSVTHARVYSVFSALNILYTSEFSYSVVLSFKILYDMLLKTFFLLHHS